MKKITQKEINVIMEVLRKYNVGVNEFIGIQDLFAKLPEIKESTENMAQQIPPVATKSPKNAPEEIKG